MSSEAEPPHSPKPDEGVGWSRAAQDAVEAEFPPGEPESDSKVRMWPLGRFLLVLLAAVVLTVVLLWWVGYEPL
jgi:hypothetical protein